MKDEIRFASHPQDVKHYDTDRLRENFHISGLFEDDKVNMVYSMYDRFVTMGVRPSQSKVVLPAFNAYTKADYFLERRELGVINLANKGRITVDGETYTINNKECLYVGKGSKEISFESDSADDPALFYINSTSAHKEYPTTKAAQKDANKVELGSKKNSNERTIYQFIHEDGIKSCQLVMGFTILHTGSIWNTFPPHTHHRRMEVYCYFDVPEDQLVMHFMGEPHETRHLVMRNLDAVISPEWSIHSGAGTSAYSFVWGMGGENKAFTDMDGVAMGDIR